MRFEGAQGVTVTDEMRVAIAAQAKEEFVVVVRQPPVAPERIERAITAKPLKAVDHEQLRDALEAFPPLHP